MNGTPIDPFRNSIPYFVDDACFEDFSNWMTSQSLEEEEEKRLFKVIYDSPGMGKTTTARHFAQNEFYVPIKINAMMCLEEMLRKVSDDSSYEHHYSEVKSRLESKCKDYFISFFKLIFGEIRKSPNITTVKINDIDVGNYKEDNSGDKLSFPDCNYNVVVHFDEIQDWGSIDLPHYKEDDIVEIKHFKSLWFSRLITALNTVISSINSSRIKVVMTGTNCDLYRVMTYGSSVIVDQVLLPAFDSEKVNTILSFFLNSQIMSEINKSDVAKNLSGRPRNVQYFLSALLNNKSVSEAMAIAFTSFEKEHNRFGNIGITKDAVFDSFIALTFYRTLGGVKDKQVIKFPSKSISPSIRDLSTVGLLRVQITTTHDILSLPYHFLLKYLRKQSNHVNYKFYEMLVDTVRVIRHNHITFLGVSFQIGLSIELMLYSSALFSKLKEKSKFDLDPKIFTEIELFSHFSDISSTFIEPNASIYMVQDLSSNKKDKTRYVDICCQYKAGTNLVCLRIEAKNYSSGENDSKLRTDCIKFFEKCQNDSISSILFINCFICTRPMLGTNMTVKKKQINGFLEITEGNQRYIVLDDFFNSEGIILPFKELCSTDSFNENTSWDKLPIFNKLKAILMPQILVSELGTDYNQFLISKFPNATRFNGFDSNESLKLVIDLKEWKNSNLLAVLSTMKIVKLIPGNSK